MTEKHASTNALDMFDAIEIEFQTLSGLIGVVRAATMAEGAAKASLRDADIPDALDAVRALADSLRGRVDKLYDAMKLHAVPREVA